MREILFRGKRVDNGEWIYGSLVSECYKTYISITVFVEETGDCGSNCYEVTPESVGQFTELLDKNGKKIFEADILKCISPNDGSEFISDFIATLSSGMTFRNIELLKDMIIFEYNWMEIEVVGNIHNEKTA